LLLGASWWWLVKFSIMWTQDSAVKTQYCLSRIRIPLGWIIWRNQVYKVQWIVPSTDFLAAQEGCMGAKIRHIAIATQDPDTIANFFKQALGLKQVGVANSDLATGYFLTDGYINLAILKFKNDYAAYTEGAPRYEGLHHFGFKVDDLEEARQKVEEAGATFQPLGGKATGQGVVDVEVKYYLPNEVRIDLSENGWLTLTM